MKLLSRAEEIILLAVISLEGNAYGLSIQDFIRETVGMEWSLAQIYDPLKKLARKGYVRKGIGEPTPARGGRHKCLYTVTPAGRVALFDIRKVQDRVWGAIPKEVLSR